MLPAPISWAPFLSLCHCPPFTHTQAHPTHKQLAEKELGPRGLEMPPSPSTTCHTRQVTESMAAAESLETPGSRWCGLLAPQPTGQGKAGLVLGL